MTVIVLTYDCNRSHLLVRKTPKIRRFRYAVIKGVIKGVIKQSIKGKLDRLIDKTP